MPLTMAWRMFHTVQLCRSRRSVRIPASCGKRRKPSDAQVSITLNGMGSVTRSFEKSEELIESESL